MVAPFMGFAQQTTEEIPAKGIVWTPPDDVDEALAELTTFGDAQVEALRTPVLREDTLFARADELGIRFYQDLPAFRWSARKLRDSIDVLIDDLDIALQRVDRFDSAEHIGLANLSNTSTTRACAPLEQLAERAHEAADGVRTYYVSDFLRHHPCAESVDLVLLDVRDHPDPVPTYQEAREDLPQEVDSGIGALGIWADPAANRGVHVPHSLEYQARYLENHLGELLNGGDEAEEYTPSVFFVYEWADAPGPRDGVVPGTSRERQYTLSLDGEETPAWEVTRGWFTGEQTVFAFEAGEHDGWGFSWILALGWIIALLLAGYYAGAPRFRRIVTRYISARGFFRDSIREGRTVLIVPSVVLLTASGLSLGIIITALFDSAQHTSIFAPLLVWLPGGTANQLVQLLANPVSLIMLVAVAYMVSMCAWAVGMSVTSRWGYALGVDQMLMLVAWSRWPAIGLMLLAVAASTWPAEQALAYIAVILAVAVIIGFYVLARTAIDYVTLARQGVGALIGVLVLSPTFLLTLILLFSLLEYRADVAFLWHLATRT